MLERINEIEVRIDALSTKIDDKTITAEERTELVGLLSELESLEAEQRAIEKVKNRKLDAVKRKAKSEEQKLMERFSMMKVIRHLSEHKAFTGAEAEVHAIGEAQARGAAQSISGFALPSWDKPAEQRTELEQRALDAATPATASNLISNDLYDMVPALRPNLVLQMCGAEYWTNLVGNVTVPAGDQIATATFNTETGTAAETTPNTKIVTLTPKRLAAFTEVTRQMLTQSSIAMENWIINELVNAEARKVDEVGIMGGGTNEPVGILGMSGTQVVSLGTNGGALTRKKLLDMETLIEEANAADGDLKFLTTKGVKGFLKDLISSSGVGPFVWTDSNTVIGYDAMASNLVPKNFTKGTGTNLHAVIFGNFKRLIVGNWGARDITVDNITMAKQAKVAVIINSFWDVQCVHKNGFSIIKDAIV